MTQRTYEVTATAVATRSMKIRAGSACEALEIAGERIERATRYQIRGWSLSMPGTEDEHWSVSRGDRWLGPSGADGTYADEKEPDDNDA